MSILKAIGAVAPIVGDLFGYSGAKKSAKQAAQQAALDRQFQMDMAKNQIQWRVADAQRAGIHPLYALGPTGMSYSPPAVVGDDSHSYLSNMGQNIDRAVTSLMSQKERRGAIRAAMYQDQMRQAEQAVQRERESVLFDQQVRKNEIELAYRSSQLARLNAPGTGVPYENAPPGSVETIPDRVRASSIGAPERSPGVLADYAFSRTARGGYRPVPSEDVKQRVEDMGFASWQWSIGNNIWPSTTVYTELNRRHPPREGYVWQFDAVLGEFVERPRNDPGRRLWEFFARPDLYRERR